MGKAFPQESDRYIVSLERLPFSRGLAIMNKTCVWIEN